MPTKGVVQTVALLIFVFILIRLFPLAVRVGEAAALGLREFWWGVLIIAFVGWLIYFFSKKRRM